MKELRQVAILLCELALKVASLQEFLGRKILGLRLRLGKVECHEVRAFRELHHFHLTRRQRVLRAMLRSYPWWAGGHLRLALTELSLLALLQEKPKARALATVGISLEAWKKALSTAGNKVRREDQALVGLIEAELKLGETKYEEALSAFEELLSKPSCGLFLPPHYQQLVESAATAALSLGQDKKALALLSRLPENKLSLSAREAKKLLLLKTNP